ncbi:PAS domain-containing sensor histidine kinase [Fulvivirga sp. 29W222]|uniref:histidine kinase n=1 Tax=Fulvivirga marina TaxID=2494733 RepID=A0A937G0V4_9BACT|nr:PAS domain-containing sensor histidine kinase [Fulvivirga marina]MBL6448453.1 PAS domain-containing sensor histidine kinase [Fulvivirga marina]
MEVKQSLFHLANLGIKEGQTIVQQRRIRLLNVITLISLGLSLFFLIIDFFLGVYYQAFMNLGAIVFVAIPVLYLNHIGKNSFARIYFLAMSLCFINSASYVTISQLRDTDTENILIGFSALIIVLYDNPKKQIFFSITALSLIALKTIKHEVMGWAFDGDFALLLINLLASFICIYIFTGAFKSDLLATLEVLQSYNQQLEKQQEENSKQKEALTANKHLLRSMIDHVPLFLAMVDHEGKYLIVNARYEHAFGLPVDEIEGKHYKELLPNHLLEVHQPLIEKCMQGEDAEFSEFNTLPSGESFYAFGKYKPVKDQHGKVTAFVVYVADITQLKNAEHELKQMNTTKNKLLSIVSHDLKSPIRSLQGLLSIAHSISPDEFQQITGKIEKQVRAVSFTMDNLLSWVKSQLEGFKLNISNVNISDIVTNCTDLYTEDIDAKGIRLINNLDTTVKVKADPDHLKLIIRNILSNSIKFTSGGTITISSRRLDGEMEIVIEDTGIGMSKEKIKELLLPHLHTSEQGTGGEQGTGLGLALCVDMLALIGGRLDIISSAGNGTSVHIYLPEDE